jgi:hypothetical protein
MAKNSKYIELKNLLPYFTDFQACRSCSLYLVSTQSEIKNEIRLTSLARVLDSNIEGGKVELPHIVVNLSLLATVYTLRFIIIIIVVSKLEYASVAWKPITISDSNKLERI